jgi:hypothetical protein
MIIFPPLYYLSYSISLREVPRENKNKVTILDSYETSYRKVSFSFLLAITGVVRNFNIVRAGRTKK